MDDILITRYGATGCYVGANDLITYTLTISNQSKLTGHELVITDVIPSGTSLYTYTMQSEDGTASVTAAPVADPRSGRDTRLARQSPGTNLALMTR